MLTYFLIQGDDDSNKIQFDVNNKDLGGKGLTGDVLGQIIEWAEMWKMEPQAPKSPIESPNLKDNLGEIDFEWVTKHGLEKNKDKINHMLEMAHFL